MKSSIVCFANASKKESQVNLEHEDEVKCHIKIWSNKQISKQLSKTHKNTNEALLK